MIARLAAVPITADSGTGALASPLLRRLAKDLDTYSPASSARLSAVVTDLITSALAEQAGEGEIVPQESRERMLRIRVTAFIERHLDDPELAPATIAAGNFVSLRHLHRLLSGRTPPCPPGYGTAGWNDAAGTSQTQPTRPCRSAP
jgi:hypothetical protein